MKTFRFILFITVILSGSCNNEEKHKKTGLDTILPYQIGIASWYGPGFDGKTTASGEIFDQKKLTAAHRRLPFGTYVLVRNRDNKKAIVVKINDRGPVSKKRIIDLSKAAAEKLNFVNKGITEVEIYIIPEADTPDKLLNSLISKIYTNDSKIQSSKN